MLPSFPFANVSAAACSWTGHLPQLEPRHESSLLAGQNPTGKPTEASPPQLTTSFCCHLQHPQRDIFSSNFSQSMTRTALSCFPSFSLHVSPSLCSLLLKIHKSFSHGVIPPFNSFQCGFVLLQIWWMPLDDNHEANVLRSPVVHVTNHMIVVNYCTLY